MQRKSTKWKTVVLCALGIFCATVFSGCSNWDSEETVLVPGTDIAVVDAYLSNNTYSYSNSAVIVFRNNLNWELPYIQMDYRLECDAGEKKYGTTNFQFDSNAQKQVSYSVDADATVCQYSILAIRPSSYDNERGYGDWTGTYTIVIR